MATIVVEDGFRVRVFGPPREHPPAHVHVEHGKEGLVVIRLSTRTKPQEIRAVYGMRSRDVIRAYRLVEKYEETIKEAWRRLHGYAFIERCPDSGSNFRGAPARAA